MQTQYSIDLNMLSGHVLCAIQAVDRGRQDCAITDIFGFGTLWKLYRKIGNVMSTIEPCVLRAPHRDVVSLNSMKAWSAMQFRSSRSSNA